MEAVHRQGAECLQATVEIEYYLRVVAHLYVVETLAALMEEVIGDSGA